MDIDFKMACSVGRKTYCTNSTLCIVREAIYLHSSYSNCVVYRVVNLFIPLKFFSLPVLISVVHEYSNHGRVVLSRGFIIFPNTGMPPTGVRSEGDHINKSCLVSPLFPIYASQAHISVYGRRSNTLLRNFSVGGVPPLHGNNPQNST